MMKLAPAHQVGRTRLRMVGSLLLILGLFALDVRDLYYKLHMMGPYDTYSFRTVGYDTIQSHALPKPVDTIAKLVNGSASAASGWPSFYARCETIHASAADQGRFFLTALAKNCLIPLTSNETRVAPQIMLTASMRVDALVAVSCGFLFIGRRPSICQDAMAIGFNDRYQIEEQAPTFDEMAQPHSDGEAELLRFLDMVSFSYPMTDMTCGEAFELGVGDQGVFASTAFACASPNLFRSEWIGFVHKPVARFLVTKGWLTVDVISFMGIRYGIRQNSIDIFAVSYASTGRLQIASSSLVNFCSFGHLYAISVLIDLVLLVAHCLSAIEMLKWIFHPRYLELQAWVHEFEHAPDHTLALPESMKKHGWLAKLKHTVSQLSSAHFQQEAGIKYAPSPEDVTPSTHAVADSGSAVAFDEVQFYSFFSRSFYRYEYYVLLTTITQILSWLIILPNAIIWTWSDSFPQQVQGFLSSIKCWVLIASAINSVWAIVVKLSETRAYQFARGTYLTIVEIIAIGALVALVDSKSIFAIGSAKYVVEKQRHFDFTSFSDGYLGYSNGYDTSQDYITTTPFPVAWMIYKPLVDLIAHSLIATAVYLTLKFAFYYYTERGGRDFVLRMLGRPARPKPSTVHIADNAAIDASQPHSVQAPNTTYARLPLEAALGCPIRAISLVRTQLSMEIVKDGTTYIRPSCYLDYGVMLLNGQIQPRVGFHDIFKINVPVNQGADISAAHPITNSVDPAATHPASAELAKPTPAAKATDEASDGMNVDASIRSSGGVGASSVSPVRKSPRGMSATLADVPMSGQTFAADQLSLKGENHLKLRLPPLEQPPRVAPRDSGDGE